MDVEIKEVKKLIKERAGVKYVERTMRRENVERARARERERERERARARGRARERERGCGKEGCTQFAQEHTS